MQMQPTEQKGLRGLHQVEIWQRVAASPARHILQHSVLI